jgi:hypothetical protein
MRRHLDLQRSFSGSQILNETKLKQKLDTIDTSFDARIRVQWFMHVVLVMTILARSASISGPLKTAT